MRLTRVAHARVGQPDTMKTVSHLKAVTALLSLALLTSCSTPGSSARRPQFTEAESADFIARYYSDQTSYLLKPQLMDGAFRTVCDRESALKLAAQQPRHELAVVVLVRYPNASTEEPVKLAWVNDLKTLGYRRVVFLRGGNGMTVNGLPVLEPPQAGATFAGK